MKKTKIERISLVISFIAMMAIIGLSISMHFVKIKEYETLLLIVAVLFSIMMLLLIYDIIVYQRCFKSQKIISFLLIQILSTIILLANLMAVVMIWNIKI